MHGLSDFLDPAFGVRIRAVLFRKGRGRKDHVRIFRGVRGEDVLDHEEIELGKSRFYMGAVGVRNNRVLAHDIQGADLPFVNGIHHFGEREPRCGGQGPGPCPLKFFQRGGVGHFLVAGKHIGKRAYVAGALHVVLAAERVQAGHGLADVRGKHD